MSPKAKLIEKRYLKGYVTDEQLHRYFKLGVITEEEYQIIYDEKHHPVDNTNEAKPAEVEG